MADRCRAICLPEWSHSEIGSFHLWNLRGKWSEKNVQYSLSITHQPVLDAVTNWDLQAWKFSISNKQCLYSSIIYQHLQKGCQMALLQGVSSPTLRALGLVILVAKHAGRHTQKEHLPNVWLWYFWAPKRNLETEKQTVAPLFFPYLYQPVTLFWWTRDALRAIWSAVVPRCAHSPRLIF